MSDYQPKVGDKVMVGEHGPYAVLPDHDGVGWTLVDGAALIARNVPANWLTPAPEPEPDEPTAPGALVRDGAGVYWFRRVNPVTSSDWFSINYGHFGDFSSIPRPITVILADPAEVEALREDRDQWESDYQEAMRQRDELQRRIDKVIAYCDDPGNWRTYEGRRWLIASWLRGES